MGMISFFQSCLTLLLKNLFASKFSPRAGVLRSPAIYIINHNNDIFVQVKKGESVGKLISLPVKYESKQPITEEGGAAELVSCCL